MSVETSWTIKRLLEWTTDFFKSKELASARLSAEILLAEAMDCNRIDLYTRFVDIPAEEHLSKYRDWVKRHAKGEPVAYLVGCKEFYSLKFEVNSSVLIPRPETEHVVMAAIDAAKALDRKEPSIVDIGTGSGCIAITLTKHIGSCSVLATDISPDALQVAGKNAERHNVSPKVNFLVSDVFADVSEDVQPDIIVSNPPYIGSSEVNTVDASVRDYEPHLALFSGDSGTEIIERLVAQSAGRLAPDGFLIFETSPIIFDQCLEIVKRESVFAEPTTIKDLAGHRRVIKVVKPKS